MSGPYQHTRGRSVPPRISGKGGKPTIEDWRLRNAADGEIANEESRISRRTAPEPLQQDNMAIEDMQQGRIANLDGRLFERSALAQLLGNVAMQENQVEIPMELWGEIQGKIAELEQNQRIQAESHQQLVQDATTTAELLAEQQARNAESLMQQVAETREVSGQIMGAVERTRQEAATEILITRQGVDAVASATQLVAGATDATVTQQQWMHEEQRRKAIAEDERLAREIETQETIAGLRNQVERLQLEAAETNRRIENQQSGGRPIDSRLLDNAENQGYGKQMPRFGKEGKNQHQERGKNNGNIAALSQGYGRAAATEEEMQQDSSILERIPRNAGTTTENPRGLEVDNHSDMDFSPEPGEIRNTTPTPIMGATQIGEVPKLFDNYTEWTQQLAIWAQTNRHLLEQQRVGIVMMQLKGTARQIGLKLYREDANLKLNTLVKELRKHYIPCEMALTIEKQTELFKIEKTSSEDLSKFIDRFDKLVNSVRRRGISLDERQLFARCMQAIKPDQNLKAVLMAQCPEHTYAQLRSFLKVYDNYGKADRKEEGKKRKAFMSRNTENYEDTDEDSEEWEEEEYWDEDEEDDNGVLNTTGKGKGKGKKGKGSGKTCHNCG